MKNQVPISKFGMLVENGEADKENVDTWKTQIKPFLVSYQMTALTLSEICRPILSASVRLSL